MCLKMPCLCVFHVLDSHIWVGILKMLHVNCILRSRRVRGRAPVNNHRIFGSERNKEKKMVAMYACLSLYIYHHIFDVSLCVCVWNNNNFVFVLITLVPLLFIVKQLKATPKHREKRKKRLRQPSIVGWVAAAAAAVTFISYKYIISMGFYCIFTFSRHFSIVFGSHVLASHSIINIYIYIYHVMIIIILIIIYTYCTFIIV